MQLMFGGAAADVEAAVILPEGDCDGAFRSGTESTSVAKGEGRSPALSVAGYRRNWEGIALEGGRRR